MSKDENVDRIIEYLAKLLPIVIVGEDEDGNKYDSKAKLKAVVDDTESLTAIITNLTSFVKENKLNGEYVDSLLAAFGINDSGIFSKLFKLKK